MYLFDWRKANTSASSHLKSLLGVSTLKKCGSPWMSMIQSKTKESNKVSASDIKREYEKIEKESEFSAPDMLKNVNV